MLEFLKVKEYKGINRTFLSGLGHINILCGKNNSGKTSVLEALANKEKVGLGKQVSQDCYKWLLEIFTPMAAGYSTPSPITINEWFSKHIQTMIDNNTMSHTRIAGHRGVRVS